MFRRKGASHVWRYIVAALSLLFAIGLLVGGASAGNAERAPASTELEFATQIQPESKEQPFDCARIHEFGIDKQTNFHAMEILAACSAREPRIPGLNLSRDTLDVLAKSYPAVYGGTDANVILPESTSYPHVTQSESMVWGHGNTVVINYNDSRAGPTCYGAYSYSTDGGANWTRPGGGGTSPLCSGHGNVYGDPIVVYNEQASHWFLGHLATACGGQGIGLWTSSDGIDVTPGACAHSGSQDDRPSMWVDNNPSSPFYGRMYISWNDFNVSAGALRVTYSDNGTTWSSPVNVTTAFIRNVQLTGGPDGTVFIASMDEGGGVFNTRLNIMQRSTDGGATWSATLMFPRFPAPGVALSGYFAMMFPTIWRHMGWGQPAVGPDGVVHYVFTQHGSGDDAADMMYTRSTDNGSTWSSPIQLNTDTSERPNWQGSLAATYSGHLFASWYDGREAASCAAPGVNTPCYRRYGRQSQDNGATWQADDMIGDTMSPLPAQPDPNVHSTYEGDYDYSSADGNTIYTTWNDGRIIINGVSQQDVFYDEVHTGPSPTATGGTGCRPNCTPTPTGTRTGTRTNTATPSLTATACSGYMPGPAVSATIVPGTNDTGNHGDDVVTQISLPFPVFFYDYRVYTMANVSSNGNLQFVTSNTAYANDCLPSVGITGPTIFAFWDDLRTDLGSCTPGPCGIYTSISGSAPGRIFNIEWRTYYFTEGSANFELRLYENSSTFDFILGNIARGGGTGTIGVQDGETRHTQIVCNTGVTQYLNKRIPMDFFPCEPTRTPGRTITPGQATATRTATRTLTPAHTTTPCGECNLDMLVVTSSCNVDSTTHWIAVAHNPDRCAVSAPWRAELQVRENNGNWRAVRIQYATTTFPHGDTVLDGTFCYRFSQSTQAVRVEYLFEDQEHRSEGSNGNVQEREVAPKNTIHGNGKPTSRGSKTNPNTCDADMASPAMVPCTRIDPCN